MKNITLSMKNNTAIVANAKNITVINDGQFRYPVLTSDLSGWITKHGQINAANYEAFCSAVDCIVEREAGTPGSQGMIDLCAALIEAGADTEVL